MKKIIGSLVMFFSGWTYIFPKEYKTDKCVMVAAPHTSNWDFVHTMSFFWKCEMPIAFFIKDSYTKGVFGGLFKYLGAIGVDRSKNNNLVDHAVNVLENSDNMMLLVPAEGTRKKVDRWKTGFYHIAQKAKQPIALGYLDYNKKIAAIGNLFQLSGDFEKDMEAIQEFYQDIPGKHPELYNKKIY